MPDTGALVFTADMYGLQLDQLAELGRRSGTRPATAGLGGAFASDTATGLIPVAHRVAGVRSFQ